MPRKLLTPQERLARKRAAWDRIKQGRPNPEGIAGDPDLWARIAGGARLQALPRSASTSPLLAALGLDSMPRSLDELKRAFRRAMMSAHPDHEGGSDERARKVMVAYETLRERLA
jgi:hypothetical protein